MLCQAGGRPCSQAAPNHAPSHACIFQEQASGAPQIWEGKRVLLPTRWFVLEVEMACTSPPPRPHHELFLKNQQHEKLELEFFKVKTTLWDSDVFGDSP